MEPPDYAVFEMGDVVDDGSSDALVSVGAGGEERVGVPSVVVRDGEAGGWGGGGRGVESLVRDLMQLSVSSVWVSKSEVVLSGDQERCVVRFSSFFSSRFAFSSQIFRREAHSSSVLLTELRRHRA